MHTDPPPELVIEIDITHPSLNKFSIFAGLMIPEVWRYHKRALTIFKLEDGTYGAAEISSIFPGLTSGELTRLISDGQEMKRSEGLHSVRELGRTLKLQT